MVILDMSSVLNTVGNCACGYMVRVPLQHFHNFMEFGIANIKHVCSLFMFKGIFYNHDRHGLDFFINAS